MSCTRLLISRSIALLCAALLIGAAATAQAADIVLNASSPINTSWATTGYWSDGLAAHSGDDYWVGVDRAGNPTPGLSVRTPTSDATFPGASLNIGNGGSIGFKPTGTSIFTFPNLVLTNGCNLSQSSDNTTAQIEGKITLSGTTKISAAANNWRYFVINAQIVGSGTFQLQMDYTSNDDSIALGATNSTFSGTVEQYGGTLKLNSSNALGNATQLWIRNSTSGPGTLDPNANISQPNTDLVLSASGVVKLDQTVNFKTVSCNGTLIPTGTYTAAALQTAYPGFFTNDGGTLIVGTPPPPAPNIGISPAVTTVTFTNINVLIVAGDKNTKTVTITNTGNADLHFVQQGAEPNRGLVLAGSPLFTITNVTPATTAALAPGASVVVTVQFGPPALSDYSGSGNNTKKAKLSIFTDVTASPRKDVGLAGDTIVPVEMSGFSAD